MYILFWMKRKSPAVKFIEKRILLILSIAQMIIPYNHLTTFTNHNIEEAALIPNTDLARNFPANAKLHVIVSVVESVENIYFRRN